METQTQQKPRYRMRIIPRNNILACINASEDYRGTGHSVMYLSRIRCFVYTTKII